MSVASRRIRWATSLRPAAPVAAAVLALSIFVLVGCGGDNGSTSGAQPPGGTHTSGEPDPIVSAGQSAPPLFQQTDQQLSQLVTAQAAWHTPSSLRAGETSRIGLSIGDSTTLANDIQSLLPSTSTHSAGTVAVGPHVSATLEVDTADASVDPSTAINASTGSDIQLLWTWYLHPKHPTDDLEVTAHIEVILSDNSVKTVDVPLSIAVGRTFSYTVEQVFSEWETWASIVTVGGGAFLAVWRRRKRLLKLVDRHPDDEHGDSVTTTDGAAATDNPEATATAGAAGR